MAVDDGLDSPNTVAENSTVAADEDVQDDEDDSVADIAADCDLSKLTAADIRDLSGDDVLQDPDDVISMDDSLPSDSDESSEAETESEEEEEEALPRTENLTDKRVAEAVDDTVLFYQQAWDNKYYSRTRPWWWWTVRCGRPCRWASLACRPEGEGRRA